MPTDGAPDLIGAMGSREWWDPGISSENRRWGDEAGAGCGFPHPLDARSDIWPRVPGSQWPRQRIAATRLRRGNLVDGNEYGAETETPEVSFDAETPKPEPHRGDEDAWCDSIGHSLKSVVERVCMKRLVQARLAWPEHPDYDLRALQLSGIENPHDLGLITADAAA